MFSPFYIYAYDLENFFNFIGTTTTARMKISGWRFLDEDFYGGRTGPLEKFYLFIYFLLI